MSKIRFGIISGAGPMAGATLYQTVIQGLQEKGAYHDADFPEILLYNYPFSDMLDGNGSNYMVSQQLDEALSLLAEHVDHIYIACQTLHLFLPKERLEALKVISLIDLIDKHCQDMKQSLAVVASLTSALNNLHPDALNIECHYIEKERSQNAIVAILQGKEPDLAWLHEASLNQPVLLGCTEYSVTLQNSAWNIVDPIKLAAQDIIHRFLNSTNS